MLKVVKLPTKGGKSVKWKNSGQIINNMASQKSDLSIHKRNEDRWLCKIRSSVTSWEDVGRVPVLKVFQPLLHLILNGIILNTNLFLPYRKTTVMHWARGSQRKGLEN